MWHDYGAGDTVPTMDAQGNVYDGEVAPPATVTPVDADELVAAGMMRCALCSMSAASTHRFCGSCGASLGRSRYDDLDLDPVKGRLWMDGIWGPSSTAVSEATIDNGNLATDDLHATNTDALVRHGENTARDSALRVAARIELRRSAAWFAGCSFSAVAVAIGAVPGFPVWSGVPVAMYGLHRLVRAIRYTVAPMSMVHRSAH